MSQSLMTLAEWQAYQTGNERANVEYAQVPLVGPLLIESLASRGVAATVRRFGLSREDLVDWFPDVIFRSFADREEAAAHVG